MLLATKDEAEVHLDEEENDFMLDNSCGDNALEELNATVIMMVRIQPTDDKSYAEPTYDAELISEVNASQIDMINGLLSKSDHEQRHHEKLETIIHTSGDDQIDSDIIFDDLYVDNNSRQAEHDTNAHDQSLHDFESLINNVQVEAENLRKMYIELKRSQAQGIDFELKLQHQKEKNACDISWKSKMAKLNGENVSLNIQVESLILMTISELKAKLKIVEKGKNVNTKFDKSATLKKLICVTPLNKNKDLKIKMVSKVEVKTDKSKPVTSCSIPKNEQGVASFSSVRRPESKDNNLKKRVLLYTKSKSTSKDVKKPHSSVSIVSNKRDTLNSNVFESNANVLKEKTVNVAHDGSNLGSRSVYLLAKKQENMVAVKKKILKEDVEKIVEGKDEESYASEFAKMVLLDEEDFGDKIEPGSHKDKPETIDDDEEEEEKKKDDKKDDDDDDDNDDHDDHALIRNRRTGSSKIRNAKMQLPIPSLPRSPRRDLYSNMDTTQELTVSVSPTPATSTQDHSKPTSSKRKILSGSIAQMARRRGQLRRYMNKTFAINRYFQEKMEEMNETLSNKVLELTVSTTNTLIKEELPKMVNDAVNQDRESSQAAVPALISQEFAAHAPKIIEELFKIYMQNTVLNVHPTPSASTATTTTYDLQHQLYLKMKTDLQA
ncbi:hypothetical protein Tco_0817496 [Tanacetum coccineum]